MIVVTLWWCWANGVAALASLSLMVGQMGTDKMLSNIWGGSRHTNFWLVGVFNDRLDVLEYPLDPGTDTSAFLFGFLDQLSLFVYELAHLAIIPYRDIIRVVVYICTSLKHHYILTSLFIYFSQPYCQREQMLNSNGIGLWFETPFTEEARKSCLLINLLEDSPLMRFDVDWHL